MGAIDRFLHVHGIEEVNACRREEENEMARLYRLHYGLLPFAGSDNHIGRKLENLAGMCCETPVRDEQDFIGKVKAGEMEIFTRANPDR